MLIRMIRIKSITKFFSSKAITGDFVGPMRDENGDNVTNGRATKGRLWLYGNGRKYDDRRRVIKVVL